MSFKKYEAYKGSGVAWLGEVPKHWVIGKVKYVTENLDKSRVPLSSLERGKRPGIYPYYGASGIIDYIDDYLFDEDTILFGEDGANLLARSTPLAFLATGKYWVNNHAHVLKAKDGLNRFWVMVLENIDITPVVSGSAQPKLTSEALGNLNVVYPPSIDERQEILTFLDKETTKIDTLIDKQEQLITLLREKRQAVISHVVTRGLNPNVKMKDSGIEWLGEVPAHWVVTQIKYVAQINPSKSELKTIPLDTPVTFLPMESIGETGRLDIRNSKRLSEVVSAGYTYLAENDVIIAKITPCFENGKGAIATGLLNGIAFATREVVPFRCFRINNQFLYFLLSSSPFRKIAEGSMYGAGGQKRVSDTFFANYKCCIPPTDEEQKQIAAFLDSETTKIDTLIEKCETAIELLKERRTALISAAVTGKIDVRSAV